MTKRVLFATVAIILAGAGLYVMSQNSKSAHAQVAQIQAQDAAAAPLVDVTALKAYVASHMGTSVSFTLTASYNRALAASQASAQAAQAAAAANANVYAAAQAACSGKTDSITQARCNQAYLSTHLVSQPSATAPVATPVLANYTYHFAAPIWTPDLAGAILLGAVVALGLLAYTALRPRRRLR